MSDFSRASQRASASRRRRARREAAAVHDSVGELVDKARAGNPSGADIHPLEINHADANGNTALHLAFYRGTSDAVDRLIGLGGRPFDTFAATISAVIGLEFSRNKAE